MYGTCMSVKTPLVLIPGENSLKALARFLNPQAILHDL